MKKILVTGGAGFVGRHLILPLLQQGHRVICVDPVVPLTGGIHPEKGWGFYAPFDFQNFTFIGKDCRDYFTETPDTDFDEVYHLAAIVGGRKMIENNPLAVADDLSIDSRYWQWACATRPGKTINFSSSAAYPVKYQQEGSYSLLQESMIDFNADIGMPDMSYGWSKLTGEYLARMAFEKHGLRSVTYRPFSGYGEDQNAAYPFPEICRRVLQNRGKPEITVWGSGRQMRDFIHISDCVKGIFLTKDRIEDGSAINLSTGIYTSFNSFARTALEVAGYSAEITAQSNTPEGVFARAGDTTLQRSMGFQPEVSLREGIVRMMHYLNR